VTADPLADPLVEALAGYQPQTSDEAADLTRILAIVGSRDPWSRETALHVTVSALVVHRATHRVLLRWHSRQRSWLQVGGHADPGEVDPHRIALREGAEETGLTDLTFWPDTAIAHLVIVAVPADVREPAHEHADIRYLLATDEPESACPENPDAPLRWLSFAEAYELIGEDNLRETLRRAEHLLAEEGAGLRPGA
jgi:8-oxo-dGTP pyrophosphatase MutT (NUDIX family)